jgi:hypothetical protein
MQKKTFIRFVKIQGVFSMTGKKMVLAGRILLEDTLPSNL